MCKYKSPFLIFAMMANLLTSTAVFADPTEANTGPQTWLKMALPLAISAVVFHDLLYYYSYTNEEMVETVLAEFPEAATWTDKCTNIQNYQNLCAAFCANKKTFGANYHCMSSFEAQCKKKLGKEDKQLSEAEESFFHGLNTEDIEDATLAVLNYLLEKLPEGEHSKDAIAEIKETGMKLAALIKSIAPTTHYPYGRIFKYTSTRLTDADIQSKMKDITDAYYQSADHEAKMHLLEKIELEWQKLSGVCAFSPNLIQSTLTRGVYGHHIPGSSRGVSASWIDEKYPSTVTFTYTPSTKTLVTLEKLDVLFEILFYPAQKESEEFPTH